MCHAILLISSPDERGITALMKAAGGGHLAVVKKLLDWGAKINLQDFMDETSLMIAAEGGHAAVVKILLAQGAKINLTNNKGKTALAVAKTEEVAQLLKAWDKGQALIGAAQQASARLDVSAAEQLAHCGDLFAVSIGLKILDIVPGRVSTEVDARLSFDINATMERARKLIGLYEAAGIERERILIKIASTWEGIQAAQQLERER